MSAIVAVMQRLMLWTSRHGLRWLWELLYAGLTRAYVAYVRREERGSAAFMAGGGSARLHGLSDIDVAIVVRAEPGGPGVARDRVRRRCERINRLLPGLGSLLFDWPTVLEDDDLRDATRSCVLTYRLDDPEPPAQNRRAAYHGPFADDDKLRLLEQPGVYDAIGHWRLLAGPDRRPASVARDRAESRLAAWLQLQYWWCWAFDGCAHPERLSSARLSVKLAAESARIWLWLTHGVKLSERTDVLARTAQELPEEAAACAQMIELDCDLARLPPAPVEQALAMLLRFSTRTAAVLGAEVQVDGFTDVVLIGDDNELWLPHGDWAEVTGWAPNPSAPPRHLPLLDWRALARADQVPDEAFVVIEGHAVDAASLAGLATATDRGPYATLATPELMLRPVVMGGRGWLRSVQCAATDPVSFALIHNERIARFPNVAGLGIDDAIRRAVREHGVWLADPGNLSPPSLRVLGRLISAARAAIVWERARVGQPELPVTAAATLTALGESAPGLADTARLAYEELHLSWCTPSPRLITSFREALLRLPAYARSSPDPAPLQ